MDWPQKCAVVIPCFNEAKSIAELVTRVRRHIRTVIVVDDGSTDSTADIAEVSGATVLRLEVNCGKGAALRMGWKHASDSGFTWALTMDGDGQHSPDDIPTFLERARNTGASLVIGNRLGNPTGMPWLRRRVNYWMTRRIERMSGVSVADSQCGFRLINLDRLAGVQMATNHFEVESEMLLAFARAGFRIEFVPIEVIYKTRSSKIHPLIDTWRWLRWWLAQPPAAATPLRAWRTIRVP